MESTCGRSAQARRKGAVTRTRRPGRTWSRQTRRLSRSLQRGWADAVSRFQCTWRDKPRTLLRYGAGLAQAGHGQNEDQSCRAQPDGRRPPYDQSKPLRIEEVELDDPGHGEVLVRIGAAGLCHSDLSVIDGNRPRPTPMVLGHEAAGIVEKLGPGVDDLKVGDHVVMVFVPSCGHCLPCAEGRPALCEPGAACQRRGHIAFGRASTASQWRRRSPSSRRLGFRRIRDGLAHGRW